MSSAIGLNLAPAAAVAPAPPPQAADTPSPRPPPSRTSFSLEDLAANAHRASREEEEEEEEEKEEANAGEATTGDNDTEIVNTQQNNNLMNAKNNGVAAESGLGADDEATTNVEEDSDEDELMFSAPPLANLDDDDDDDDEEEEEVNVNSGPVVNGSLSLLEDSNAADSPADEDDDGDDEDDDAGGAGAGGRAPSLGSSRRNKRKNFKPRNIYADSDAPAAEETPLNLTNEMGNQRKSLMPRRLDNNSPAAGSPMDLSTSSATDAVEAAEDKPSLSVVRPEILFGRRPTNPSESEDEPAEVKPTLAAMPKFPFALSSLLQPGLLAAASAAGKTGEVGRDAMKDAFQEVLKLYGVPVEIAEAIAKNAQNAQNAQDCKVPANATPTSESSSTSSPPPRPSSNNGGPSPNPISSVFPHNGPPPPGMLSAALLGAAPGTPTNDHPPTPPRTPKTPGIQPGLPPDLSALLGGNPRFVNPDIKFPSPKMGVPGGIPPLLSLASIQEQTLGKPGNILASHLAKPNMLLPGMPPGMPGQLPPHLGGPPGPIPPHILAAQRVGMLPGATKSPTDYTRYFKRFGSSLECGSIYCKDSNFREHFHCTVPMCKDRVFAKKEEMIRHSKWHQKMEEAFKYGFRRVTPMDDCSDQFRDCQHNKKQTHYHCIHTETCDKVYISTSDVQMHFNYHRKDNAIQREGFLRFRGCEDCATSFCPFRTQKTTHFHCNRSGCNFTFKNKADMEKHKNYHMKDEQLNKDGFKKFMKNEPCGFSGCRFTKTVNHIHCIRSQCDYVLHSSGQLYSHKRKHERKDSEVAYQKYKMTQNLLNGENGGSNGDGGLNDRPPSSDNGSLHSGESMSSTPPLGGPPKPDFGAMFGKPPGSSLAGGFNPISGLGGGGLLPPPPGPPGHHPILPGMGGMFGQQPMLMSDLMRDRIPDDVWRNYMLHFDSGEGCGFQGCELEEIEHFHCKDEGCETVFRKHDGVQEHGRNHFLQDQITELFFLKVDPEEFRPRHHEGATGMTECPEGCPHKKTLVHFHCKWENCSEVVFNTDPPFKRLDHYKLHEYTRKWNMTSVSKEPISMTMTTSIDTMFKRKRGRPPKNRVVEVWNENVSHPNMGNGVSLADMSSSPQAVFTSFKLPKPGLSGMPPTSMGLGIPGMPPVSMSGHLNHSLGLGPLANFHASIGGLMSSAGGIPGIVTTTPSLPNVLSAPLGGLPAMASQIAAAQHAATKSEDEEEPDVQSVTPPPAEAPATPPPTSTPTKDSSSAEDTPTKQSGMIKARGTYYPLTAFPTSMPQGPVMRREDDSPPKTDVSSSDETSPTVSLKSKLGVNFVVSCARQGDTENALAKLLAASKEMVSSSEAAKTSSHTSPAPLAGIPGAQPFMGGSLEARASMAAHPVFGPEPEEDSCGRPFCKLKRRAHYHCNLCNQGFTEKEKLEPHLKRHVANPAELNAPPPSLASLLRDGIPREPLPLSAIPGASPLRQSLSSPPIISTEANKEFPPSLVTSFPTSPAGLTSRSESPSSTRPRTSPSPGDLPPRSPAASTPLSSIASPLLTQSPTSPFLAGLPPHLASLVRVPFTNASAINTLASAMAASAPGLPPGMPFFPPGMMLPGLPGLPALFGQRPGLPPPTFDPTKHPLTRMPDPSAIKNSSPLSRMLEGLDDGGPDAKKMRLNPATLRMMKDEPVPEGYMRFRFNEDCGFTSCNYREHQTHFHCMRKDCNYRFCDKTRFVQHTARHERLDTLCGSEFEGFRGVTCAREACEFNIANLRVVTLPGEAQKSSSHFHCLKCDYSCTDTNKVVAHRRQHQKLDNIMAAGFEKYTPTQNCTVGGGCTHNGKQTHYHCNKCQYAVLGLSQMEAHKYRHPTSRLAYFWRTLGVNLASTWCILGKYLIYSWGMLDIYLACIWRTFGVYLA